MENIDRKLTLVRARMIEKALTLTPETPPPTRSEVALAVADARAVLGATQQKLADQLGVNISSVSRWEAGELNMRPSTWRLLLKLASEGRKES